MCHLTVDLIHVAIIQQFLYFNNICSFSNKFMYIFVLVADYVGDTQSGRSKSNPDAKTFSVWWDNYLVDVEIFTRTKLRSDRPIYSWDITTSGFHSDHFIIIGVWFCVGIGPNEFHRNLTTAGGVITSLFFSKWRLTINFMSTMRILYNIFPEGRVKDMYDVDVITTRRKKTELNGLMKKSNRVSEEVRDHETTTVCTRKIAD